jgi:hypothetical protein
MMVTLIDTFYSVSKLILYASPVILPFILLEIFIKKFISYTRARYLFGLNTVLLEIKLPQDVFKSPLAMETFLDTLYQTGGEGTFIDRYWKGQVRSRFSLEIVSVEGVVRFYIFTEKKYQHIIEAGLYSQYPNIEIHESQDYTKSVFFNPKENDIFFTEYILTAADPYPIKTYVDYGIDKESVDEEYKIDPINTIIEFMGSIGANQQCWLQIIIRAHKKEQKRLGTWFWQTEIIDKWKEDAKEEIEKIRKSAVKGDDPNSKFPNPTKGEQEKILAIERSISKVAFDVGIRGLFFAKKDFFIKDIAIGGVKGLLRSYNAPHLNGFRPSGALDGFDYPWQDKKMKKRNNAKNEGLIAYKRRGFFGEPFDGKPIILNVEELASIFHLPGRVTTTPTLNRIPSKKSEAPANLPI